MSKKFIHLSLDIGGRGGIRTHGTIAGTTVFKTVSIDHSDTLPNCVRWRITE
jgi:hypothetical protein